MNTQATRDDIINLINRQKAKLGARLHYLGNEYGSAAGTKTRARYNELSAILDRITAHQNGIRDIGPSGD